jgi:low affinity Fe/Cu permease
MVDSPMGLCEVLGMNRDKRLKLDGNSGGQNTVGFRGWFRFCARWIATATGSPWAFVVALTSVVVWGLTGPMFHYSDTWQLVINTATTIITFLMVFLIQNTQNRDTKALHLKLDELLRGVGGARTSLVNLENLSDEELESLQKQFERIKRRADRPRSEQRQPRPTSTD